MTAAQPLAASRLYFLDWVRIVAFALLVPYHVGMYYVTWDFHIKSPSMGPALEPWMRLVSPWRMDVLFLVSGVATAYMLMKRGADGAFLRARVWRLLLPLVFGMLVIVPPQSYLEVVQKYGYGGGFIDFLGLYLSGYKGFCSAPGHCLMLPTWNHLWYLPYLLAYTFLLWGLMRMGPRLLRRLGERLPAVLAGPRLIVLPVAYLVLTTLALRARFPATHALADDWYAHCQYFAAFALGAALAHAGSIWTRVAHLRVLAAALALASWALLLFALPNVAGIGQGITLVVIRAIVYSTLQWCGLVAALGFAAHYLKHDNAARRYLTQAVFPVYILHQTIIIILAHAVLRWALPAALEGAVLVVATFALSLAGYEAVRRVRWLRPLFGLRKEPEAAAGSWSPQPLF